MRISEPDLVSILYLTPKARPSKIGDFPVLTQTPNNHHTHTTEQIWLSSYRHQSTFAPPSKTSAPFLFPLKNLRRRQLHRETLKASAVTRQVPPHFPSTIPTRKAIVSFFQQSYGVVPKVPKFCWLCLRATRSH